MFLLSVRPLIGTEEEFWVAMVVVLAPHLRTPSTQGACFWRAAWTPRGTCTLNFSIPHPPVFTPPDFFQVWTPRATRE